MVTYPPRYEGKRWSLLFGSYQGVEHFAVNEVQKTVQRYLPYVVAVLDAEAATPESLEHVILVGTPEDNIYIRDLADRGLLALPEKPQGFTVSSLASPWGDGNKIIVIAGTDAPGVMYGAMEFITQQLHGRLFLDNPVMLREAFDGIEAFEVTDFPRVQNRGIWTWGYVVYDYRRFFDNMARLRMNMITLWNDCPPVNAREVIDYAHSRGIQVVMGFHWGWGQDFDPNSAEALESLTREVRENYLRNYHGLDIDGIYFQTFTETYETEYGGKKIATLACEWVNHIARALYEIKPDLYIQFGLHALSVADDAREFAALDPRITITWEDAGAIPWSYEPVPDIRPLGHTKPESLLTPEGMLSFSRSLVGLHPNPEFAMVPKGWTKLRWDTEFEHHGPFILGERDPAWMSERKLILSDRWARANALWLRNYPLAASFYRTILDEGPGKVTLTALVEDGLFEEAIEPSVALFAETAWNPYQDDAEILRRSITAAVSRGQ